MRRYPMGFSDGSVSPVLVFRSARAPFTEECQYGNKGCYRTCWEASSIQTCAFVSPLVYKLFDFRRLLVPRCECVPGRPNATSYRGRLGLEIMASCKIGLLMQGAVLIRSPSYAGIG